MVLSLPEAARLARSANPTRGSTTETLNKRQLGYHRMPDDLTRSFNVIEIAMYPKPAVGLAYDTTRGPPQGGLALFGESRR